MPRAADRLIPPRSLPLVALLVLTMLAQIAYPLNSGAGRDILTAIVVISFAALAIGQAARARGLPGAVALLVIAGGTGLAAELIGVHTGFPFGPYRYASSLGPRFFGVPLLIVLAWPMMAWPAALVARRLATRPLARVLVGVWALAAWDLFLDPQMVAAGHWTWTAVGGHLPGVPSVPLTNFAGWLLVSLAISAGLQAILRSDQPDDRLAVTSYLWVYASSVLGLALFLGLPAAAGWGALGMGLVAIPLAWQLIRDWQHRPHWVGSIEASR
jgi:putative membrane protein